MLIIDTETSGLDGAPKDRVLEIGIARLDEVTLRVSPVYEAMVRYPDGERFFEEHGQIWVFENTDLSPGLIESQGDDIDTVVRQVRRIVAGCSVASYNVSFDFGRFLFRDPWSLGRYCTPTLDIMEGATSAVRELAAGDAIEDKMLQRRLMDGWRDRPGRRVRAIEAYLALCPDDPADRNGVQSHRALDDAILEAHILRRIWTEHEDTAFSWPTPSPVQDSWRGERCTSPAPRRCPCASASPTAWTTIPRG